MEGPNSRPHQGNYVHFPSDYLITKVEDFHWEGTNDLTFAGDAQSIANKDWVISHLTETQEGIETDNWDQAWRNCLQLLSSIGLMAGRILGPLVVMAPVVRRVVMQEADPAAVATKVLVLSNGEVRVRPGTLVQGGDQRSFEIAYEDNQELLCCHADGPGPTSETDYLQIVAEVWWARQAALGLLK